jgi:hypothetical protein
MSVNWNSYEIDDAAVSEPANTLPRSEARQAYERLMRTKHTRIEVLRGLLKTNGIQLDSSDAAVQDLNDWFYANIRPDPDHAGRMTPQWYSVASDIALFLGDVMIERSPNLHWEFFTWGKKNVSYQRHVIMGFGTEDPKLKTNIDIERRVATYGHRIIAKRGSVASQGSVKIRDVEIDVDAVAARHRDREIETDAFRAWLQNAAGRA